MKWAIKLAVAFYVMQTLAMLNIVQRIVYGEWEGQGGNKIGQLANLMFILVSGGLFCCALPRLRTYRTTAFLALGISVLLLSSAFWSVDPAATIRRGVTYLAMVMGAIGIAGTLDCDEYMAILMQMCSICAGGSLGLLVLSPHLALMDGGDGGTFVVRGILSHKNSLGQAMAAGTLAGLHGLQTRRRRALIDIAMLGVFLGLALLSRSATALLIIVFYAAAHLLAFLYRKDGTSRIVAYGLAVAGATLGGLCLFLPDLFLGLLGKDPTLTGRSELWVYVWKDIDLRPLIGWGYAGFWTLNNPAALEVSDAVKWFVPQAHNGVLEMLLDVGYLGCALFVGALLRQMWRGWLGLATSERTVAITSLISCGGIIILGISETVLLEPYEISTSIFFVTGMLCDRALAQARGGRRLPQGLPQPWAAKSCLP